MKKTVVITSILIIAVMLCTAFVGCFNNTDDKTFAYVSMDINPSVNMVVDGDTVKSVEADNEDAQIMLYGEEIEGMKLEEAVKKITTLAIECGYLSEDNHGINLTVTTGTGESKDIEKIEGQVSVAINSAVEEGKVGFSASINTEGSFSLLRQLEYYKEKYPDSSAVQSLTIGKLKLILELQEYDNGVQFTAAAELDTDALIKELESAYAKIEPYATKAYEKAIKEATEIYNMAKTTVIDSVWVAEYTKLRPLDILDNHGAKYMTYDVLAMSLDYTLDKIEEAGEYANYALANVDTQKIADALGVEKSVVDEAITDEEGKITLESIEKFIDSQLKNMSDEAYQAIKEELPELMTYISGLQTQVDEFINSLPEEYATRINAIIEKAGALSDEIKGLIKDLKNISTDDLRSVVDYCYKQRDIEMQAIEQELTEEELTAVKQSVQNVNDKINEYETTFKQAVEDAKLQAQTYLQQAKDKLTAKNTQNQ